MTEEDNQLNYRPKVFNTQREAFWYRQGIIDTQKSILDDLETQKKRYTLEWLDHLPIGDKDRK